MKYITPYTRHPRNNLPNGKKRAESNFVLAFGRVYRNEVEKTLKEKDVFKVAREVYIPGLGIADIVSVLQKTKGTSLYAFEMKLKGWRKALSQAYRYKYYSNAVYVVLPLDETEKAKESINLFKVFNIGLLAFDSNDGAIFKIFNPKEEKPLSQVTYRKALNLLSKKFKSLLSF